MSAIDKGSAQPLMTPTAPVAPARRSNKAMYLAMLPGVLLGAWLFRNAFLARYSDTSPTFGGRWFGAGCANHATSLAPATCPVQPPALNVGDDWDPLHDKAYGDLAARRLSAAVQHATESFDDMPMDATDPAFDKFHAFNDWLYAEYPKVFGGMKHELVNTHGHLLTWQGSNPSLQPILLMAHTDVVPVLKDTEDEWTYPPFEGKITHDAEGMPGTWIWGRGASDCKNTLLGIYGALERLVTQGWKPERTILVANGFDEEIGGPRGAQSLAKLLEERYAQVALLVDEGMGGITYGFGKTIVNLDIAEKGSMNVLLRVETPGGHSSQPEKHTGIGVMADLLYHLEQNPFKASLTSQEPFLKYLTCLSDHAPEFPNHFRKQVRNPRKWPALAEELAENRYWHSLLSTTQAIDVIKGGLKSNALPEFVESIVNYRIAFTSSVKESKAHLRNIVEPVAKRLNFTYSIFEDNGKKASPHHITVTLNKGVGNGHGEALEPAPFTPDTSRAWELMAGTSKLVFGEDAIVAPTGMYANTDSKWFWALTDHIYRFNPSAQMEDRNRHTVDERISLDAHLTATRWFYALLQNSVGWDAK